MKTDSVLRSTKIKKIKSPQKRGQAVFLIVMLFVPYRALVCFLVVC